jgi:hypothetical protein
LSKHDVQGLIELRGKFSAAVEAGLAAGIKFFTPYRIHIPKKEIFLWMKKESNVLIVPSR